MDHTDLNRLGWFAALMAVVLNIGFYAQAGFITGFLFSFALVLVSLAWVCWANALDLKEATHGSNV